ncbi:MAG: metal ABC transporter substrate-binding protein [Clostridiales bacterium]|nr:metal ABC transporter substrate-binding protein [Clostridiales bacterium]
MKKLIRFLTFIGLSLCLALPLAACAPDKDGKPGIVCSAFPQYDWARQIIGGHSDGFEITYLLRNGVDAHNYQPSVADVAAIISCDLFIYIGGPSDEWAEDVLDPAVNKEVNKDMKTVVLVDAGDAQEEKEIEGAQPEEEEEEGPELDEHVWVSLRKAQSIVDAIADAICEIDAANAGDYRRNAENYKAALAGLDAGYQAVADAGPGDTVLFADRFPFRYMADDYGLTPYAAFPGCSAETEASFETITGLSQKIDELNLNVILRCDTSDGSIAETVKNNTAAKNQTILVMNPCEHVTGSDIANGTTYLSIMASNLGVLRQALA